MTENSHILRICINIALVKMYVLEGNVQYLNILYDYFKESGNSAQSVLLL